MVRNILALLLATGLLFGCDKSEQGCASGCGTLRDKYLGFNPQMGTTCNYVIDYCNGTRATRVGYSSYPYDDHFIGDQICNSDIY
jgi:hypothetical protein